MSGDGTTGAISGKSPPRYLLLAFTRDFLSFAKSRALGGMLLVLLGAAAETIGILLLVPFLAILTADDASDGIRSQLPVVALWLLPAWRGPLLLPFFLGAFVAAMIVRSIIIFRRDIVLARLQSEFVEDQRRTVLGRLAATDWPIITRLSHARITHVLTNDIDRSGLAAHQLLQLSVGFILTIAQGLLAFLLSPWLALLSLALLAVSSLSLRLFAARSQASGHLLTDTHLRLMKETGQFLGGLKQAISEDRQGKFVARAAQTLQVLKRTQVDLVRHHTLARVTSSASAAAIAALCIWLGVEVLDVSTPVLLAFLLLLARLSGPLIQAQQSAMQLLAAVPAHEAVQQLIAELIAEAAPPAGPVEALDDRSIRFDRVTYRHPGKDGAELGVFDLDILIPEGEFIGVRGRSGSGKTTFADLIAGLHVPQHGSVSVGGCNLSGPLVRAWRAHLAYVDQEPFFFHGSMRDNLLWERDAPDEEMWEALTATGGDAVAARLAGALDAQIGESGLTLSGGERQRLAIARALLRRPKVLILDEATSALDPGGEAHVLANVRELLPHATILLITHRAEPLLRCSRILSFEEGRLVAGAR